MQINELLDRFEILYPDVSSIADLRRAYTDKDLSSLFRIVNDDNKENLRKLIMEDNTYKLWPLLDECVYTIYKSLQKFFYK
jgi:hypothetical protein